MAKNKVELEIQATDNASRTMGQVAESVKRVDSEAGKTKQGLASLGQQALQSATTGKVNFEALAMSLVGIVPLAAAAAAAIAAIGAAANASREWFLQVDQFSDLTGTSIEESSVLVSTMEIAGANSQRMATSFAMLNQRLDDEARAAGAAGAATGKLGTQLSRVAEDHAERLADAAESLAERLADLGAQRADVAKDSTRKIAGYERDLADMRRDADYARLERAKAVARQIADLDTDAAEERMALESMFAGADTELGKKARAAELAALEQRTGAKRGRIQEEERDANDAAEREVQMRQAAVQEQIALEREAYAERLAAFDKMQAKIEAAAEKASAREAKQYARQMEDLAVASAAAGGTAATAVNSTSAAFERLGIDVDKYRQLKPAEQFKMVADALNNVTDETEKSKLAMELFGRFSAGEWMDTIRIVKEDGWGELEKKARSYGTYISTELGDQTQKAIDKQNELNLQMRGFAVTIGNEALPAAVGLGEVLAGFMAGVSTGDWAKFHAATEAAKIFQPGGMMGLMSEIIKNPSNTPGGGRALGGPVESGMPYLVGERGPEMFMPRQPGTIVNNWNYSPAYGGAPANEPGASFALMRAMAGA